MLVKFFGPMAMSAVKLLPTLTRTNLRFSV